ncbi:DUF5134 domain-containing protein [Saccharopolyspora sp. 5N102]|uniref:DUF5134 domain-containing protein n=1 Tax=Saccharopolyspora sp. 5N102 TaxID=3375155 RepID=UPI0037A82F12
MLAWLLTVLYAATSVWCGIRVARPSSTLPDRISFACHLAMSWAMIAMLWPWGTRIPEIPQIVFFALATAWFLLLAGNRRLCGHGDRASGPLST